MHYHITHERNRTGDIIFKLDSSVKMECLDFVDAVNYFFSWAEENRDVKRKILDLNMHHNITIHTNNANIRNTSVRYYYLLASYRTKKKNLDLLKKELIDFDIYSRPEDEWEEIFQNIENIQESIDKVNAEANLVSFIHLQKFKGFYFYDHSDIPLNEIWFWWSNKIDKK